MTKRDEIDRLTTRVTQLESQLAQVLAAVGPLVSDTNHLTALAQQASRLNHATEAALRDLLEQPTGIGRPRFEVALNTVYRADYPGYVSMVFRSGRTGSVQILAGPTDPPTEPVSFPGDTYVGGFIRRGEFWTVSSSGRPAFKGTFTPIP